jgi:endonuclease YncB( thermonuclease family)
VTDGDTAWFRQALSAQAVKVRLAGLDAPEICQHWGRESRQALASVLQRGRWVAVQPRATDGYGRTVAQVWAGGWDVSAWMVAQGHAWADPRDPRLMALQAQAQQAGRGLFASPAVLPKDFRRWHGSCQAA